MDTSVINKKGNKNRSKFIQSTFIGFGKGNTLGSYSDNIFDDATWEDYFAENDRQESAYNKYFVQHSVGFSRPRFDMYITLKSYYLTMNNLKTLNGSISNPSGYENDLYSEPTITFSVGSESIRIITQVGVSAGFNHLNGEIAYKHRPLIGIMGLRIGINSFGNNN